MSLDHYNYTPTPKSSTYFPKRKAAPTLLLPSVVNRAAMIAVLASLLLLELLL